jgi:phosphohistidine phosphatase
MKRLLILRHAKSSWRNTELNDHERPLKKRGRRDAPRVGRYVAEAGLMPAIILSSDAKRARDTARLVIEAAGYDGTMEVEHALYLADPEDIVRRLQEAPAECPSIMVVGHNPGLEDLLAALAGRIEPLPTAALAVLELDIPDWSSLKMDAGARLIDVWRPRERE